MSQQVSSPDSLRLRTATPDCFIRPWHIGDEASLAQQGDNPNVARYLVATFPRPYTLQDAQGWISSCSESRPPMNLAIEYRGAAIGGVGGRLGAGEMRKTMTFGYWIGEAFWGRGIATGVVAAYVPYAFASFNVERIEAHVFAPNLASARVLEKCGFSMEGRLARRIVVEEQMVDEFMFARLRDPLALRSE